MFVGPALVELREVEEPEPTDGDVLIHVRAAGICGSELHGVRKPGLRVPPLIMGHEFAGTTDDGDDVVVNPLLSCGHCDLCKAGLARVCRKRTLIGIHRPGGFAERVAVPRSALRPIPSGMSWEAAAIAEPAANAVHAWNQAGGGAGSRIGVIGAGAIGLVCLLVALNRCTSTVEVVDLSPARLDVVRRLGATTTGAELRGEFDVIFDAVGSMATRGQSLAHLRPAGTTVWLGLADEATQFDASDLVRTEKRVVGSFAYSDEEFDEATDLVRKWDLTWTTSYPLDRAAEIFTELMDGGTEPVKALLRP